LTAESREVASGARDGRCLFCGGSGPLSREHAIPLWVASVLDDMEPGSVPPEWYTQYNAGGIVERDRQYPVGLPGVIVRSVCEPCNNGWMARMEGQIRPIVEPMIRGRVTSLSVEDQINIATWASKTSVALESHEPTTLVTLPQDRALIRTQLRPPAHHRGRLAYRESVRESLIVKTLVGSSEDAEEGVPGVPDVFARLIGLGFLFVQVWGGHGSGGSGLATVGTINGRAIMIWPPTPGTARWPPAIPIEESEFDDFAAEVTRWPDDSPGLEAWRQMRRKEGEGS
jgi:hypothetical protein